MRLNKYLARCGIGSRRQCDEFIDKGQIKINGIINRNFSYQVQDDDYVQFKNKILNYIDEDYIYIVNKPRGYISTLNDPKNRKKVIDLIPTDIRLFNIGRLDYNTTGIILFTNNGDIANKLLHPRNKIIKRYYVETSSKLSKNNIDIIRNGLKIPDFGTVKADISLLEVKDKDHFIWDVVLTEGKNREIKRIFSYFDSVVRKLHRYEFAGVQLNNIKSGKYRRISYKQFKKKISFKSNLKK